MSEVTLTVRDAQRDLHCHVHGSEFDLLVAALSADPETIEELQSALARFMHREHQERYFARFSRGIDDQPWDAGVCIIDLAARLVVIESTYSHPGPEGYVTLSNLPGGKEVGLRYHLADDWKFLHQVKGWESQSNERRHTRLATPPLDARAVLYGKVCEFVSRECRMYFTETASNPPDEKAVRSAISKIHARWLLTPRDDLRGQCPRDLLVAGHDHMSWDMQDRSEQWSQLMACPPGLSPDSAAYRLGGFGTHEIVLYYDLVRDLLWDCWQHTSSRPHHEVPATTAVADAASVGASPNMSTLAGSATDAALADEIRRLEALRDEWLQSPNFEDLHGRTPASVIERERRRLPEGQSGAEAMVDHDCPLCRMMADDLGGVYFWGLDGCNMDDDFAFDFHHRTREEWDKEQREQEEWHRKFEEKQKARAAAGATGSVWQTSYVNPDFATNSPTLNLFGLGTHLAELTQNLKDAAEQQFVDDLNRDFGNLRDATENASLALIDPVVEKMCDTLVAVTDAHPALTPKCDDLERQLKDFAQRMIGTPLDDEEIPF